MADISKITLPDNTTYNIKDKNARNFTNTPYYEQDEEALMFQLGDSYMTGEQDNQPYLFRAAGGSADIGNREYDKIIGGTVAWNQLVRDEGSMNETDFADIITVDDAVEDAAAVKVAIEPVQDLHGYDHPWPAGGTKNKMPNAIPKTETINGITFKLDDFGVFTVTGTATSNASCDFPIGFSFVILDGDPKPKIVFNNTQRTTSVYFNFFNGSNQVETWNLRLENRVQEYIMMRGKTCNSYRITVLSGETVNMTISPMIVKNSVTDYTYIPYSNICPITGFDSVKVTRTGKNLFNIANAGTSCVNSYGMNVPSSGTRTGDTIIMKRGLYDSQAFFLMPRIFLQSGVVKVSADVLLPAKENLTTAIVACSLRNMQTQTNLNLVYAETVIGEKTRLSFALTITDEHWYDAIQIQPLGNAGAYNNLNCQITNVQIELGSIATDYESYQGQTYDIAFPTEAGTVYGGELTVNKDGSGSLVVNRAVVDLGTLTWNRASGGFYSGDVSQIIKKGSASGGYDTAISSQYKTQNILSIAGLTDFGMSIDSGGNVQLKDSRYSSAAELKTGLNGVQMCYELATPITYSLTASEIRTLLGTNNVWSDAGQVALIYTGTDEHLTLESGRKYLVRISGTDSMLLGSGQEITVGKGTNNVFDITQMFGSTIANYIYSLETATPGAGVAWFRKLFPKPYYEYNPGELMSVQAVAHKLVGFNAWDEKWQLGIINTTTGEEIDSSSNIRSKNYIRVIPGATYYFKLGTTDISNNIVFYDAEKNYVAASDEHVNDVFTVPENAHYMKFYMSTNYGSTYLSNICINLSGNGERDGEYEEYKMHSYPLDSSLILRGIPKLDANNQLYYDGDTYEADGTVTRKYAQEIITTGTAYHTGSRMAFKVMLSKAHGSNVLAIICNKVIVDSTSEVHDKSYISCRLASGVSRVIWFFFPLSIADTTEKANAWFAQNEVKVVYELKTPTIEIAEPYDNPQIVDPEGTEEYITTNIVFVGHETKY